MPLPPRWQWKLDRWRERMAASFKDESRETRPRLCPSCGTLVGVSATKCHECGTSLTYSMAAVSKTLGSLLPENAPATYIILFVNGILFVLSMMMTLRMGAQEVGLMGGVDYQALLRLGGKRLDLILFGEVWRLVMPIFLHGGLMHIGMNSIVLMDIGSTVEETYGSARYLFLYVFIGIFSFVVSALWAPFSLAIGASGSLMGLVGLMIAITQRHGGFLAEMYRKQLVRWVIYVLIFGFLPFFPVDNAAHLGGLAAGYVLGKLFEDRQPMNARERQRAYLLGWTAFLIVVASFAAMLVNYFRATQS